MDRKKKLQKMSNHTESSKALSTRLVSINDLSDVCLAKIFSCLSYYDRLIIEEVCRKWKDIGSQLSWNNVKEFKDSHLGGPIDNKTKLLQRCGRFLTVLSSSHFFNTSIMRTITKYCPNLVKINLTFFTWNSNDFVGVFYGMKKLKSVFMSIHGAARNVDGYILLKNLPETVEEFLTEFVDFDSPTAQNLGPLSEKLGVLHHLTLDTGNLDNQIMEWIINKKSLVHLDLETSSLTGVDSPTEVDLPNLEYLQLSGLDYVDDELIISFIQNCKKLKYFNISDSTELAKKSLRRLGDLKNLEELYLSDQSDAVTDRDVENIKNLKVFECANCKRITDRSIMKIITNSWRLEKLDVLGTRVTAATLEHADSICKSRKQKLYMTISERIMLDQEIENEYLTIEVDDDGRDVAEPSDDDSD